MKLYNQTAEEIRLEVEEMEEVIAPLILPKRNHNETLLQDEEVRLEVEELEEVIAPITRKR